MTDSINLQDLKKPLPPDAIEWRISQSGVSSNGLWAKAVPYKTARTDMDRLDDVCGPENWQDEYRPGPNGGVICGISIKINGEWVEKWDGADNTNYEGIKGGLSDAFKRAGTKWGIGRELYQMEEQFVETSPERQGDGWNYQSKGKSGTPAFYWRLNGNHTAQKKSPPRKKQEPLLKYQDGSTVQVGNSAKAMSEQTAFTEYVKAHDGQAPRNIHNLRNWKENQSKDE